MLGQPALSLSAVKCNTPLHPKYHRCVWVCHVQAERMADALVIASVGGSYLFEKAQKEYMRRAPRPYMKIVSAIMSHDLTGDCRFTLY